MRVKVSLGVAGSLALLAASQAAASGHVNPHGYGLYSPEDARGRVYRYDPRSWYYRQPGYYPYYSSNYWVPRAQMRYRYRRLYYGPPYRYHPAWGYPRPDYNDPCCHWGW
jgi:hypothetical protein